MTRRRLRRERIAFNRHRRSAGDKPDWEYVPRIDGYVLLTRADQRAAFDAHFAASWAEWVTLHDGRPPRWWAILRGTAHRRWRRAWEKRGYDAPF